MTYRAVCCKLPFLTLVNYNSPRQVSCHSVVSSPWHASDMNAQTLPVRIYIYLVSCLQFIWNIHGVVALHVVMLSGIMWARRTSNDVIYRRILCPSISLSHWHLHARRLMCTLDIFVIHSLPFKDTVHYLMNILPQAPCTAQLQGHDFALHIMTNSIKQPQVDSYRIPRPPHRPMPSLYVTSSHAKLFQKQTW